MRLSVSQIGWSNSQDDEMYGYLHEHGVSGVEIAPGHFVNHPEPYGLAADAESHAKALQTQYGLIVPSMQAIWYGRTEHLFGPPDERATLLAYTKQAIRFAAAASCPHLVFGSPKNRITSSPDDRQLALEFFREIGCDAVEHGVTIGIEANPPIYGTNFINTTAESADLVREIGHPAVRINLDIGTIIENDEALDDIERLLPLVSHVHLSEPYLVPIVERNVHMHIAALLRETDYRGYISLEMRQNADGSLTRLKMSILYMQRVFGDD